MNLQQWYEDVGTEAELLWAAGATFASESTVNPSKYCNERRWQFVQSVHWRLQELWDWWGPA